MACPKPELVLSEDERLALTRRANRSESTQRPAVRARIVLACDGEPSNKAVAERPGVCGETVGTRRGRLVVRRLDGPADEPPPGAPRAVTDGVVERIVTRTPETKPANATRWSTPGLARTDGLSQSTGGRVQRASGLKPHRTDTFKLSTDPYVVEKVRDVAGLYPSPPEEALVLCIDRSRKCRPRCCRRGWTKRTSHDSARHGTTSLFAVLNWRPGM